MPTKHVGGSNRNTGQADGGMYPGCLDAENHRVGVEQLIAPIKVLLGPKNARTQVGGGLTSGAELKAGKGRMPRRSAGP